MADQAIWFDVRHKAGATEFLGYDAERAEAQIKAIVIDGRDVPALQAGQTGWIIVNQTPFYAESGGQLGDTGKFIGGGGAAAIADVQKRAGDLHALDCGTARIARRLRVVPIKSAPTGAFVGLFWLNN